MFSRFRCLCTPALVLSLLTSLWLFRIFTPSYFPLYSYRLLPRQQVSAVSMHFIDGLPLLVLLVNAVLASGSVHDAEISVHSPLNTRICNHGTRHYHHHELCYELATGSPTTSGPATASPTTIESGDGCCETAYAHGTISFLDASTFPICSDVDELKSNRWGWIIDGIVFGEHVQAVSKLNNTLWAGAGQGDTTKGADVGFVDVHVNSTHTTVDVHLHQSSPALHMKEIHLNLGYGNCTVLPVDELEFPLVFTTAPGQYKPDGLVLNASRAIVFTHTEPHPLDDPDVEIVYVTVHSTVCGFDTVAKHKTAQSRRLLVRWGSRDVDAGEPTEDPNLTDSGESSCYLGPRDEDS